jgi:hypothetical protein
LLSYNSIVQVRWRGKEFEEDKKMDHRVSLTSSGPSGSLERRRRLLMPAVLLGIIFAATACSNGPPSPGVAGSGPSPTTSSSASAVSSGRSDPSEAASALAFSQCMRTHGVSNFPDPNGQGQIQVQGGSSNDASNGLDPNSPAFQSATNACQHLMPAPTAAQQHQALSNALKQSQCMRAHGIKDFPDPSSSSGRITMTIHGGAGSDLNPNDPLFQHAQAVCMPNAPKPPGGANSGKGSGTSSGSVFRAG